MTTPSFDSVESQASYGIGLQVGQQLQESGLQGLQPEALLAGLRDAKGTHRQFRLTWYTVRCVKSTSVPKVYVVSASKPWRPKASSSLSRMHSVRA